MTEKTDTGTQVAAAFIVEIVRAAIMIGIGVALGTDPQAGAAMLVPAAASCVGLTILAHRLWRTA